ncbi:hypothetical protein HispidOSU_025145 [Sigmodon hispidus]
MLCGSQPPGLVWEEEIRGATISFNLESGERQDVNIHQEETTAGDTASQASDTSPDVTTPCHLCRCSKEDFLAGDCEQSQFTGENGTGPPNVPDSKPSAT